jgi:hypothetical protein
MRRIGIVDGARDQMRHPVVDRPLYRHDDHLARRRAGHEADLEVASGKQRPAEKGEAHCLLHGARLGANLGVTEG